MCLPCQVCGDSAVQLKYGAHRQLDSGIGQAAIWRFFQYKDFSRCLIDQKAEEFSAPFWQCYNAYSYFSGSPISYASYAKGISQSPQSLISFHLCKTVSPVLKTPFNILYTHLPSLTRKAKAQKQFLVIYPASKAVLVLSIYTSLTWAPG